MDTPDFSLPDFFFCDGGSRVDVRQEWRGTPARYWSVSVSQSAALRSGTEIDLVQARAIAAALKAFDARNSDLSGSDAGDCK